LAACITACNECHEELQYCLSTFHGLCPPDINIDAIYIFLDGCPDESMQAGHQTFQSLVSIMGLHVPLKGVVVHEGGCRVYPGSIGKIQARLFVKGHGEFQRSKRRSMIAFHNILAHRISSGQVKEPLAVLHMDADTGSAKPGMGNSETSYGLENVASLVRIMRNDVELGALSSQVRVLHRTKNLLALMQSFDLNATYVGEYGGASAVGRSVVCIGMAVLYRYRALHFSEVKGQPMPLVAFSGTPDKSIVDLVHLDMNEDQGMTAFMLRAGYATKTSAVPYFHTFAPETLSELMGQRRRWQAGYLVGLPAQMFSSPWPHLQSEKFRCVMALALIFLWAGSLIMPGSLGFGLALLFNEAYIGIRDLVNGGHYNDVNEHEDSLFREAVFASCVWTFWIVFIVATIDKAPKKIRTKCQFFFTAASLVSVTVMLAALMVSPNARVFNCILIGITFVLGLALTFDVREWPHRALEFLPFFIFTFAIKPMFTMYAVANCDSALWGTRSVGNVSVIVKDSAST
ncbi:unnamed protein product, partial [Ascophyllum nodosum]